MENWQIKIKDVGYKTAREVFIFRRGMNRQTEVLQPDGRIITVQEYAAIDQHVRPILELEPEMLQALSDELALIGYKPQKGFMEGKLQATENHLKDMRTLLKLK